jgi:ferredoxin/flavodoxin---NADP+ reductase
MPQYKSHYRLSFWAVCFILNILEKLKFIIENQYGNKIMNFENIDEYLQCRVISNEMISNTTAVLKIKRPFSFKAGQCINISVDKSIPPRMYSISSSENDNYLEIIYKIVNTGKLTPLLKEMDTTNNIYISRPFGKFCVSSEPSWLIATGTGVAPYLSMILSGYSQNKVLIHGNSNISDFYLSKIMENKLGTNYIRCYSGTEKCDFFKGRVLKYLVSLENLPKNNKYYLCGSAEMVVEIRDFLISRGIPFQNTLAEIFF